MEEFGRLQLDGTDSDSSNAGSFIAAEEDTNVRFVTEESGILLTEDNSTHSFDDYLLLEDGDGNLEYEVIVFDGGRVALESFEIKGSEGQIPFANLTLNSSSSPVGGKKSTQGSIINVRSTGEISLEDGTMDEDGDFGKLVLDTSADENDNIDLEGATGIIP